MLINFSKIKKLFAQDIVWKMPKFKKKCSVAPLIKVNRRFLWSFLLVIFIAGFLFGVIYGRSILSSVDFYAQNIRDQWNFSLNWPWLTTKEKPEPLPLPKDTGQATVPKYTPQTSQEDAVINVVKNASPSVVSVIITKEVPVYETYYEEQNPLPNDFFGFSPFKIQVPKQRQTGTKKQRVGEGTGFIVSADGFGLTNKHVVADKDAQYTVLTVDGKIYPAKVLARDPFQDLAVIKIEKEQEVRDDGTVVSLPFPALKLGDSSDLQIGQTVVAIGNALGELSNTVSVGVISGLGRTITASGGGISEILEDVIQTDAAINLGNSGGPLLNLRGEVVGVNVAMAQSAQSIGFAILINGAKKGLNDVETFGKIIYPFLGVRHMMITPENQEELKAAVDYGSLIAEGNQNEPAVATGSPAYKAGLKDGDIILEIDGLKITKNNSLGKVIRKYQPGDEITLKILRNNKEIFLQATLDEKTSE